MRTVNLMKELEDFDSKIYERLSRAESNSTADATLTEAKTRKSNASAKETEAKATKIQSETDILDQEFLHNKHGINHSRDLDKLEAQTRSDMAKQAQVQQSKQVQ